MEKITYARIFLMNVSYRTAVAFLLFTTAAANANIIRWDTNAVLPGTQAITLAPNVDLSNWDKSKHTLQFALFNTDLTGANFQKSDLRNAKFAPGAIVTNANFTKANILGTHFDSLTSDGFTFSQLASTASYISHNLTGITLENDDLSTWNFDRENLTNVDFTGATLTNAAFLKATITGATFDDNTGLTLAQLQSTASYAKKNLHNIKLIDLDLSDANFAKQNLSNSTFQSVTLVDANFTSANLTKATVSSDLAGSTFTKATLAHTNFTGADLTDANFTSANLTNATLGTNLAGAIFLKATLSHANFANANLTNANFANATITGTNFDDSTLTTVQLATTANYKKHNLSNALLSTLDLSDSNFTKQSLTSAKFIDTDLSGTNFTKATLTKTNFSEADLRGATAFLPAKTTLTANAILPDGSIHGLFLTAAETLTIHNNPLPITVNTVAALNAGSTLQFILESGWTSPINFSAAITPTLGGTLDLEFPLTTSPASVAGDSFQLFNWNTAPAPSDQFAAITTDPRLVFNLSQLYTTGLITVSLPVGTPAIPAPEPASLLLLTPTLLLLKSRRRSQ